MDPIVRFGERLHEAFEKGARSKKLAGVGGNFTIVVYEKAAWSVFTKGPKLGIIEAPTDDTMDFVMIMTVDVFEKMYQATEGEAASLDVEQILAENKIAMYGDPEIFYRFLALNAGDSMLSLRAGGAAAVKSSKQRRVAR
jgi:hypothetical protein